MRLSAITALDIAGVRPIRQPNGSYAHACVVCGSPATTGRYHTQCSDPACRYSVLSPLDTVAARFGGDHSKAAAFVTDQMEREAVDSEEAAWEATRRRVMDFWIHKCLRHRTTTQIAAQVAVIKDKGWFIMPDQTGMAVIAGDTISSLILLAAETGAEFPDILMRRQPATAVAMIVQSVPHTIDRIVITTGKGSEWSIVWNPKRVGVVGMLGMRDNRLVTSDYREALALQRSLSDIGSPMEVSAVFIDRKAPSEKTDWKPDVAPMTTVVGNSSDVITMATFYEAFPKVEEAVLSAHLRQVSGISKTAPVRWTWMRRSYIAAAIDQGKGEITSAAAHLIEQCNPAREEIAWLIQRYRENGQLELAEDIKRHMDNRVIAKEPKYSVRETASDYLIDYGGSTTSITNFTLQFRHNLIFRESQDVFHAGRLTYGRSSIDVVVSAQGLDNLNEMQKTLRQQLYGQHTGLPDKLPTIFEPSTMRKHVLPYLKRQVAGLPSKEGFFSMGWTADRSMFVGPGVKITMNGREYGPVPKHPNVAQLRHFADSVDWDVGFSENLPTAARDIVAMILASCARFFVMGVTRPICVQHSPEARHLLTAMFATMGQREIFELNPNLRDPNVNHGVRGYPFLTTGYNAAQSMGAKFGHVLLTDTGYSVSEEIEQEVAEAAGRSLQFSLLRLVEWCLGTEASGFSERPALHYNSSLLREGQWLVENVCELQPWEVSDLGLSNLEGLLSQIPVGEIPKRMAIKDGTTLTADLAGLDWDREAVRRDLQILRSRCDGEGDELVMGAVEILPALETFYGRRPEVAVVI
jgi:hypothetical protein